MSYAPDRLPSLVLALVLGVAALAALGWTARAVWAAARAQAGARVAGVAAVLVLAALAVRLVLPPAEPVDMVELERLERVRTNLASAAFSVEYVLLRPLILAADDPLRPLKAFNLAAAVLAPLLLAWLVGRWSGPPAGLLAGLLLVVDVAHARLAVGSDPAVAAPLFVLAALAAFELVRPGRDLGLLLAAGVLAALGAGMRQEAPAVLPALAALVVLDPGRRRDLWPLPRLLALALPVAVVLGAKLVALQALGVYQPADMLHRVDVAGELLTGRNVYPSLALTWAALGGALVLGRRRGVPVALGAFVGPALVLTLATWTDRFSGYRYFVTFAPFALAGAAVGVAGLVQAVARAAGPNAAARVSPLVLLLPPALLWGGLDDLQERNAIQCEHAFLARAVPELAAPALVVVAHVPGLSSGTQVVHRLRQAGLRARLTWDHAGVGRPRGEVVVLETAEPDARVFAAGVPVFALRGWAEIETIDLPGGARDWARQLEAGFERRTLRCEVRPRPPGLLVHGESPLPEARTQRFCLERLSPRPVSAVAPATGP